MSECVKCGKEHGMVIENMETGETKPIDCCEECLFPKRKERMSDQNEVLIRDMLISNPSRAL